MKMEALISPCDSLEPAIRAICRGENPHIPLHDVNLNRAAGFGGRTPPLPPLQECVSEPDPSPESANLPPLLIRGWNFAKAMARWTLGGMPRRSQAEIEARLAICQACEFLKNNHCTQCGCACVATNRLINKLALATESCPLGRWPAESPPQTS